LEYLDTDGRTWSPTYTGGRSTGHCDGVPFNIAAGGEAKRGADPGFTFLDQRLTLIGLVPEPRPPALPALDARLECMSRFHTLPGVGFTAIGDPLAKRSLSSRGPRGVITGSQSGQEPAPSFMGGSQPERSSGPGAR